MWNPSAVVRARAGAQRVAYEAAPAWTGACAGGLRPGATTLKGYLMRHFDGLRDVQGYACRPNTADTSMASMHSTGRALDVFPTSEAAGDAVAAWLLCNAAAIGVQYVIWQRVSWNGSRPAATMFRAYTGPDPHTSHLHVELTTDAAAGRTPWFSDGIGHGPVACEGGAIGASPVLGVLALGAVTIGVVTLFRASKRGGRRA